MSPSQSLWNEFSARHQLTPTQEAYFKEYYDRLIYTNTVHNITAITDLARVISDHFDDSLALKNFIDCSKIKGLADIGTGAGFPGVPLKLLYPEIPLFLIEVHAKKRAFLQELISAFKLSNVVVSELDWRTFLRNTDYDIDLFCARASLAPEELIRLFKPSSPYKNARLIYWASGLWKPSVHVAPYIRSTYSYLVDQKERELVCMSLEHPH